MLTKYIFHTISGMNIGNMNGSLQDVGIGKKAIFGKSGAYILMLQSVLVINTSHPRIQKGRLQ